MDIMIEVKRLYDFGSQYDEAEFYPQATVAVVTGPSGTIEVDREGDSYLSGGEGNAWSTPGQFRARFPEGKLPWNDETFEWQNNGWFCLYRDGILAEEDLYYSLEEAIARAEELVR